MNNLYRYFSQYGEDFLLWNFFDFKSRGYFVDIGAFDGVHLSNSYSFELGGWKGVCVEPHPFYFDLCRKSRPKSVCINKACGSSREDGALLHVDNTGLFSSLKNIGTDENITGHFGLLKDLNLEVNSIQVDVVTLNSVLESNHYNSSLDFVSIDVEGAEAEVLHGFDINKHKPRVLVVETNNQNSEKEISSYLADSGYLLARRTKANSFFVSTESDVRKFKSIELNCVVERQIHPLGREYTIPSYLNGLAVYQGKPHDVLQTFAALEERMKVRQEITKEYEEQLKVHREQIEMYQEKVVQFSGWLNDSRSLVQKRDNTISDMQRKIDNAHEKIALLRERLAKKDKG